MNIFQNYDITYNNLKEIDFTSVFYAAFIDTMSPVNKKEGAKLGHSPSDLVGKDLASAHKNGVAWNAFFGYRANNEEDYDVIKYLRRAGRTGWNFVKLFTEFPVRLLDYGVEKALANSWDATEKLYNDPFKSIPVLPWLVTGFASLIFLAIHIPLKITSLIIRSQTSSSTLFAEADAINPTLGKLVRVLSIGLSIAICVAIPVVAPYFVAINANAIAQGLNVIGHGLTIVGEALGVTAGLSAAIAAGAVVTLGAITAIKATINLFSNRFNSLFKKAPATYDKIGDNNTVTSSLTDSSEASSTTTLDHCNPEESCQPDEKFSDNITAALNVFDDNVNDGNVNLEDIHNYLRGLDNNTILNLVPKEIKNNRDMENLFISEVQKLKNINVDYEALKNFFIELETTGTLEKTESYKELANSIVNNSLNCEDDDNTVVSQQHDVEEITKALLKDRQDSTSSHGYNS